MQLLSSSQTKHLLIIFIILVLILTIKANHLIQPSYLFFYYNRLATLSVSDNSFQPSENYQPFSSITFPHPLLLTIPVNHLRQQPTFSSITLATPSTSSNSNCFLSTFCNMWPYKLCTVWLKDALVPVIINTWHLQIC